MIKIARLNGSSQLWCIIACDRCSQQIMEALPRGASRDIDDIPARKVIVKAKADWGWAIARGEDEEFEVVCPECLRKGELHD